MSPDQMNIPDDVFSRAVAAFWATRNSQGLAAPTAGGQRGSVVGGRQMDGFFDTIVELLDSVGLERSSVFASCTLHNTGKLELPGFFRPTKEWDMLIVRDGKLLAALELKSQVGPSFGNNFNNRTEEAMGSALDLWTAYREGAFRQSQQPWLGYLFLLEECANSTRPVRVAEPHFPVFPEFRNASYAQRYEIFCRKLVLERHYSSSCFLLSAKTEASASATYREPASDLGAKQFLSALLRHVIPMSA
jgi:hypothetical protein